MTTTRKPDFGNVKGGSASSAAEPAQKADFGNVQSGASSTAPARSDAQRAQTYTVNKGDSLSKIARAVYGDANRWHDIFAANRDQIDDPNLIHPGQVLKLPGDSGSTTRNTPESDA
jgi:nucleoid-associated protein YgaU